MITCENLNEIRSHPVFNLPEDPKFLLDPIGFCEKRNDLQVNEAFCLKCKEIDWFCPCGGTIERDKYERFLCTVCKKIFPPIIAKELRAIHLNKVKLPRPKFYTYEEMRL